MSPQSVDTQGCTNARIVIVDDERLNVVEMEAFLRTLGYDSIVCVAPDDSLCEALRDAQPDIVLIELALKDNSAFAALRALREDRVLGHVPVIAITSLDDRPQRLQALAHGASDYLVKPVDPADLELRLRNALTVKLHHDRLAYTDPLTGLPNRESTLQRLEWAVKFAQRHGANGAVLKVGLDRFGQVNEALGPSMSDELLRAVGMRLVNGLRATDLVMRDAGQAIDAQVARGDGDEFTILLPAVAREADAGLVAQRIVDAMADPFRIGEHELFVTCHVGIAVFASDGVDKETVLRQAKLAMRHARRIDDASHSRFRFYSQELNGRSASRLSLERELRRAIEHDELVLHYQPKVDMRLGNITGAEALVRWQHPSRGLLGPGAFIDVAEETGLIVPLGEWVLHEALRQMAEWHRAGAPQACVAVNVSSLQLRRPGLDRKVQDALARSGHLGSSLCLELTETAIMETGLQVTRSLQAIKEMGVRLALDDFGTGYSSLSYLRRFPIDELKVDRSFVSECGSGTGSAAVITQAVIAMAHGLGLTVVAEGIETEQQLAYLRMHACDQFQGYLYSRPVPAAEFAALLSRGHAASTEREPRAPQAVAAPRLPSIDQGLSTMEPVVLRASSSRWDSATSASA